MAYGSVVLKAVSLRPRSHGISICNIPISASHTVQKHASFMLPWTEANRRKDLRFDAYATVQQVVAAPHDLLLFIKESSKQPLSTIQRRTYRPCRNSTYHVAHEVCAQPTTASRYWSVLRSVLQRSCHQPALFDVSRQVPGGLFIKGRKLRSHVRRSHIGFAMSHVIHETNRWCDSRRFGRKLCHNL